MVCLVEEKNRGDEREKEMKRILWLPVCHVCVYTILLHESLFGLREQNRESKEFYQFMTLDVALYDNIAWVYFGCRENRRKKWKWNLRNFLSWIYDFLLFTACSIAERTKLKEKEKELISFFFSFLIVIAFVYVLGN